MFSSTTGTASRPLSGHGAGAGIGNTFGAEERHDAAGRVGRRRSAGRGGRSRRHHDPVHSAVKGERKGKTGSCGRRRRPLRPHCSDRDESVSRPLASRGLHQLSIRGIFHTAPEQVSQAKSAVMLAGPAPSFSITGGTKLQRNTCSKRRARLRTRYDAPARSSRQVRHETRGRKTTGERRRLAPPLHTTTMVPPDRHVRLPGSLSTARSAGSSPRPMVIAAAPPRSKERWCGPTTSSGPG
jgi:hypothetical protein